MVSIILVRPETSGNIGFIARAMANFDFEELILIQPECDPFDDEAIKKSMHAKKILKNAKIREYSYFTKKVREDFDLIIGTTSLLGTDYNIPRIPMLPETLAKKINLCKSKKKIALVFGNEGNGLTNEEINVCDFIVTIPTSNKYPALNISHAASILFYEIYKQTGENKIVSHIIPISRKEKEIIMKKLDNLLDKLHFSTKEKKDTQKRVWKKIFEQSMMSKREAFAVLGFFRKLENKLENINKH